VESGQGLVPVADWPGSITEIQYVWGAFSDVWLVIHDILDFKQVWSRFI
jgi:hypothetical protein